MTAPRDPLTALQDVVGEAEEIAGLVDGLHRDAFLADRRTQLAVGMCFITPGAVEPEIVWRIACDNLPELRRKAVSLISELEAAPGVRQT